MKEVSDKENKERKTNILFKLKLSHHMVLLFN